MLVLAPLSVLFLNITGRSGGAGEDSLFMTTMAAIFKYIGAPLLNLNNYLSQTHANSSSEIAFGEQTFRGFYQFIYSQFSIEKLNYDSIVSAKSFVTSANGLRTGNVFTTFYMFVYDFGLWGIIPLMSIISFYYCYTYSKIKSKVYKSDEQNIDFRLFIYAYLFNELIMLFFSNRFFETVATAFWPVIVDNSLMAISIIFLSAAAIPKP